MENTMQTIDLTPTWEGILPAMLTLYAEAETIEAKQTAYEELTRMARLADKQVAQVKALREASQKEWRAAARAAATTPTS
jgi:hypothetical protein